MPISIKIGFGLAIMVWVAFLNYNTQITNEKLSIMNKKLDKLVSRDSEQL